MPGLDPGIHAFPIVPKSVICTGGTPWMTGSSPAMTIEGRVAGMTKAAESRIRLEFRFDESRER